MWDTGTVLQLWRRCLSRICLPSPITDFFLIHGWGQSLENWGRKKLYKWKTLQEHKHTIVRNFSQNHQCPFCLSTILLPLVPPPPPTHFYSLGNPFYIDTVLLHLLSSFFLSNPFCSQPFFFLQFTSFLSSNTAEKVFRCEYLNKLYVPVFLLLIFSTRGYFYFENLP